MLLNPTFLNPLNIIKNVYLLLKLFAYAKEGKINEKEKLKNEPIKKIEQIKQA